MEFFKMLSEAKLHSRMNFEGLDISVEVPAGGYRRGTNKKTGEAWAVKVPAAYGYIKGTHSPDGEHLDCYVRKMPKRDAKVYVMHQLTVDGTRFDEDKVMLGYSSKAEAIRAFKDVTFKSTMYGGCTEFDMETFQIIAYSASKSTAMLTDNKTYMEFKKRGLLGSGIRSPLDVARRVSESLAEGLAAISDTLYKGDLLECLEWGGMDEGFAVEKILNRAWGHYMACDYMHDMGALEETEFKEAALNYLMERDALLSDTEDFYEQETATPECVPDLDESLGDLEDGIGDSPVDQIEEVMEDFPMSDENYVVVVHTQIMENIGSLNAPSWATAGTNTQLVEEGFATYGAARAVAAKVAAGVIPVAIKEGSFVLGIDVITEGEYRQFHEDNNAEPEEEEVKETMTDDVFFQQQIQEVTQLAGVHTGSYENKGTPTVHETRARLEALTQEFYEGVDEALVDEGYVEEKFSSLKLSPAKAAEALRTVKATVLRNPKHHINNVIRAVCKKKFGDENLDEEVIQHAELEYGSLDEFEKACRGNGSAGETVHPKVITKHIDR